MAGGGGAGGGRRYDGGNGGSDLKELGRMEREEDNHYMDKKGSGKEISEEVTRVSLIAISYSDPEKDLSVRSRPENSKAENVGKAVNVEGDDNCRSKLISMSYPESSDTNFEPVTWRTLRPS
ncbi:hypothetical protein RND71_015629 [Anisodus tanguticus]|uniref:Uncharacterized protein n=1 Tax=Anisodus tanguticus TaxID=243964 RepID=A0AAE1VHV5_9SOLA|nr:hypothetical protein RND71_015629 [Anisodus tanguticus]